MSALRAQGNAKLLELATILDASMAARRKYDQTKFQHEGAIDPATKQPIPPESMINPACGSPACALGHWAFNHPETWALRGGVYPVLRAAFDSSAFTNCVEVSTELEFGISEEEHEVLFGSSGCGRPEDAGQAADYIRRFVAMRERGEELSVTWSCNGCYRAHDSQR